MSRLKIVTAESVSRPDPVIFDALDDMVRKARTENPVTAMLIYETTDGGVKLLSYPDSVHLRLGLIDSLHEWLHLTLGTDDE